MKLKEYEQKLIQILAREHEDIIKALEYPEKYSSQFNNARNARNAKSARSARNAKPAKSVKNARLAQRSQNARIALVMD